MLIDALSSGGKKRKKENGETARELFISCRA
jgi:hypothetical protein